MASARAKKDERFETIEVMSKVRRICGHLIESAAIGIRPTVEDIVEATGFSHPDALDALHALGWISGFHEGDVVGLDGETKAPKNKAFLELL